nr:hypothetical protein [Tanacetum cinerariifolium]
MINSSNELFFFKFGSKDGMDATLENSPWFIRKTPLILKKWTPNVNLLKENVGNDLVWVKFHDVLIMLFREDRLSAIATKLHTPLMLDSYTSIMYTKSWGRSSYARAMIELRADVELKDTIVVVVPKLFGKGFSMCTICIEHESKPLKCSSCKGFGHGGSKLGFKLTKQVYQPISEKNGASASSKKKQDGLTRLEENSKLAEKGANSDVVSSAHGTSSEAFCSPTINPLTERINDIEREMLDRKPVCVDDDGKSLKRLMIRLIQIVVMKWKRCSMKPAMGFIAPTSSKVDKSSKSGSGVGNKIMYK